MSDTVTQVMRPRFKGHSVFNASVKADWMKAIERDPDAFDALLYIPVEQAETDEGNSNYEADIFDEIDANQDVLSYADPVPVAVLDCPDETEAFWVMDNGAENAGEGESPLVLRIAADNVPIGSVLEWQEEVSASGKLKRVWWYVHRAQGVGSANVGVLYICIPCRDFEHLSTENGGNL